VLDSTGDGIIGVRADGTLSGGSSAAAQRWFGAAVAGKSAAKYLFPNDENGELFFAISVEQMFEGFMPWDVVAAQAPRTVRLGDQVVELEYKPVEDQTDDVRLLVVARDVTARVVSEHAEQAAREQHGLVARLLADKQGFAAFVKDVENLIQTLGVEKDSVAAKRYLHTVKGNVALFGLGSVASLCHQIEDQLDGDVLPSAAAVADLSALFSSKLKSIEEFLTGLDEGVVEVETDDHTALIRTQRLQRDHRHGRSVELVQVV
jgi:HPt (histidine-containing phosphotransfer) domain-containing protein